jgi:hypothetical protein
MFVARVSIVWSPLTSAVTVFFLTYAAFEVPSNLLLKRLRPSIWLPSIMVAWGIVMVRFSTSMGRLADHIDIDGHRPKLYRFGDCSTVLGCGR